MRRLKNTRYLPSVFPRPMDHRARHVRLKTAPEFISARRGPVVAQHGKARELLASGHEHLRGILGVGDVRKRLAAVLHRQLFRGRRRGLRYGHVRLATGSGTPSLAYIARRRVKMPAMISGSPFASPGGSAPFQCHCSQRPVLVRSPLRRSTSTASGTPRSESCRIDVVVHSGNSSRTPTSRWPADHTVKT